MIQPPTIWTARPTFIWWVCDCGHTPFTSGEFAFIHHRQSCSATLRPMTERELWVKTQPGAYPEPPAPRTGIEKAEEEHLADLSIAELQRRPIRSPMRMVSRKAN